MRIVLLAAVLAIAPATVSSAAEFAFHPPDGLECEQVLGLRRSSALKDVEDPPPAREEESQSVTHLKYEKVPTGYRVRATVKTADMKRDGVVVTEPILQNLVGRELVLDVDSKGALTDVHGYEDFVKTLMNSLPPEGKAALEKVLTPELMRDREITEWNGRIASFVGKEAKEGDAWEEQTDFALPTGAIKYTSLTRISKVENRGSKPLVTINFAYAADGKAAKDMMALVTKDVSGLIGNIKVGVGEAAIQGGGERVVDADTMTIERETISRVISMPMDMPDVGKATMLRTETRTYSAKCK